MDTNLVPHEERGNVTVFKGTEHLTMDLDTCIGAWLHAKHARSESQKTATAYKDTLADFRHLLQEAGHDLDSDPTIVAPLAQGWAATSKQASRVTPNTYNQRLAILSSFYKYAIKHEVLVANPIERVERRVVRKEHAAQALAPAAVSKGLKAIDRQTPEGKRDHALLQVALATGRRVGELAAMRYGHLTWAGTTVIVRWPRCKGNKTMTDTLPTKTTAALLEYLHAIYGKDLTGLGGDAPIWVSFSDRNQGQAVSTRTLQRICDAHFHTSKFHATRHTWAVTMHKTGARLADIGRGLGHSNLKTTSDYLEEQLSHENPYAETLEEAFGFEE